jgi:aminotransferase
VLCSPSNPTGACYDEDWLQGLAAIARYEDLIVVSDEVYAFMTFGDRSHRSIATFPGMADRTIVIGSFSKVFGVSGWRLGFMRCPLDLFEPLTEITDCVAMQAPTPNQVVLEAALDHPEPFGFVDAVVSQFERRRDALLEPFRESSKTTVHEPDGGFYLLPMVASEYREPVEDLSGYAAARDALPDEVAVKAGDCLHYHLLDAADMLGVQGRTFGEKTSAGVRLAFGQETHPDLERAASRISDALESF